MAGFSVVALTTFALLFSGCGGGEDTLSKAEFIKQGDAICGQIHQAQLGKLRRYVQQHPGSLNIQPEIARDRLVLALASPLVQREAEELAALPAPKGDEAKIKTLVSELEAGIKKAEEDPKSTVTGTYRQASELAAEYGFRLCRQVV